MISRIAIVAILVLTLAGCGGSTATQAPTPPTASPTPPAVPVVASFYPMAYFTQRIGGERVQVKNLVPAGAEPHEYEPTPQDVTAMTRAKLIVYNGAGLEPWVKKLLPQLPAETVKVEATKGLPLVKAEGALDPHIWLDPVLAQQEVDNILAGLVAVDPQGKDTYQTNAGKFKDDLQALDRRFAEALTKCKGKTFITAHEAFGYLATRYRLTMVAISGLSPEAEPSPAKLKEVTRLAKKHGTKVLYVETLVSSKFADTIAREVDATVRVLNPLEGLTDAELAAGKDYLKVMDENLTNLKAGLNCG